MEIDVTRLVTEADAFEFSASIAERGVNAGKETWANSLEEAKARPLLSDDQLDEARDWARDFGAWDDEQIDAWSADEVNALVVQYVAGNLREIEALCMGDDGEIDWAKAEAMSSEGRISGNIWPGGDGRFWFYLGS